MCGEYDKGSSEGDIKEMEKSIKTITSLSANKGVTFNYLKK